MILYTKFVHNIHDPQVSSEQAITRRGLKICQKGDQIKTLTENRWDVASQSTENVWYRVSFDGKAPTCECPYHIKGEGRRCKHIAAIEHILLISEELSHDNHITIKKPEVQCPDCNSISALDHTLAGAGSGRRTSVVPVGDGSEIIWAWSIVKCRMHTSH